ncbi:MAG: PhzF family phenazine biosynthesis protein [Deinococcota bacterium]
MRYQYYICDVFTETRFSGNPLAVFPHAEGLNELHMQQIAREFNFSETTFVLPPERGHTRRVRIFTPTKEIPFAGHPNVGTAFVLASIGELGELGVFKHITFEEDVGSVPITIRNATGLATGLPLWCELEAPKPLSLGVEIPLELIADALSVSVDDIATSVHKPQVASVGFPFVVVEVHDAAALAKASVYLPGFNVLDAESPTSDVHLYTHTKKGHSLDADIHARMFSPLDGATEDPATGSANGALAGLLTHYNASKNSPFSWRMMQGVTLKRPSYIDTRTEKEDGKVAGVWIGGNSVMVAEGTIEVD